MPTDHEIENARAGYQAAVHVIATGGQIWPLFYCLVVGNSIFLGAIGLGLKSPVNKGFITILCVAGIVLCVIWLFMMRRAWHTFYHWIYSAREMEGKYLCGAVQTVTRGAELALGNPVEYVLEMAPEKHPKKRLRFFRRVKMGYCSYAVIFLFVGVYITILAWLAWGV